MPLGPSEHILEPGRCQAAGQYRNRRYGERRFIITMERMEMGRLVVLEVKSNRYAVKRGDGGHGRGGPVSMQRNHPSAVNAVKPVRLYLFAKEWSKARAFR